MCLIITTLTIGLHEVGLRYMATRRSKRAWLPHAEFMAQLTARRERRMFITWCFEQWVLNKEMGFAGKAFFDAASTKVSEEAMWWSQLADGLELEAKMLSGPDWCEAKGRSASAADEMRACRVEALALLRAAQRVGPVFPSGWRARKAGMSMEDWLELQEAILAELMLAYEARTGRKAPEGPW